MRPSNWCKLTEYRNPIFWVYLCENYGEFSGCYWVVLNGYSSVNEKLFKVSFQLNFSFSEDEHQLYKTDHLFPYNFGVQNGIF